jgi:hypothetical protein
MEKEISFMSDAQGFLKKYPEHDYPLPKPGEMFRLRCTPYELGIMASLKDNRTHAKGLIVVALEDTAVHTAANDHAIRVPRFNLRAEDLTEEMSGEAVLTWTALTNGTWEPLTLTRIHL